MVPNHHMGNRGEASAGAISRVILEINQASGPRDTLKISSGWEQGLFRRVVVRGGVLILERAAMPW